MPKAATNSWRYLTLLAALAAGTAQAHTGHETASFIGGLVHPFGLDHLLAMVAVGVWSVFALPAARAWWGPATFMGSLLVSAALGHAGIQPPYLEHAIALSVVMFGAMLVLARAHLPPAYGVLLIALAAALHGLAHGSETPETGFAGYAVGFLVTTAALHVGGVIGGLSIKRWLDEARIRWTLNGLGVLLGASGLILFGRLT